MKSCPKCNIEHNKNGIFCTRSCANSKVQTSEQNEKRRAALSGKCSHNLNLGRKLVERINAQCCACGSDFEKTPKSLKKYCSSACSKTAIGGYREGSGRAKTGHYRGIYCGSTYELIWAIYQFDNNLDFTRFEGILEYEGRKYVPDFLQDGKIIEIKGYEDQASVDAKTLVANKNGYDVKVLRRTDLNKEFDWVKQNYTYSTVSELYDDHKPKYHYQCVNCGVTFDSDRKRSTPDAACGSKCSMLNAKAKAKATTNKKLGRKKGDKLSKEQALAIFNDATGSLSEIASRHNTTKNMVFFIKKKKCYSWIH